jgi:hypothetical protein
MSTSLCLSRPARFAKCAVVTTSEELDVVAVGVQRFLRCSVHRGAAGFALTRCGSNVGSERRGTAHRSGRLGGGLSRLGSSLVVLLPGRQHGGQGQRDNMNTATNRDSRWMFPGRRAGQPMHPDALAALVNGLGIPTVAGRASAIRQHVLEMMPAPVVATTSPHQAGRPDRKHLEPVRLRRPPTVTIRLNTAGSS